MKTKASSLSARGKGVFAGQALPCPIARKRGRIMKIVVIRSPKLLAPLLARLFGVSKKKGS